MFSRLITLNMSLDGALLTQNRSLRLLDMVWPTYLGLSQVRLLRM